MYQSQFTNEKLRQTYRTEHEQKVVLAPLMVGELRLTAEPTISEQGELVVKGRLPCRPGQSVVGGRVLRLQPEWLTVARAKL